MRAGVIWSVVLASVALTLLAQQAAAGVSTESLVYAANPLAGVVDVTDGDGNPIRTIGAGVLTSPTGLGLGPTGNVWVTDANGAIREFASDGAHLRTFTAGFPIPNDVTVAPDGTVYVAYLSGSLVAFGPSGLILFARTTGSGSAPFRISLLPDNLLYLSLVGNGGDLNQPAGSNDRIDVYQRTGAFVRSIGTGGSLPGQLNNPGGVVASVVAGQLVVVDRDNERVQTFTDTGSFVNQFGSLGTGDGQFTDPQGIARLGSELFVSDTGNDRNQVFNEGGTFIRKWNSSSPADVAVAAAPAAIPPAFTSTPPTQGTVGLEYSYDANASGTPPLTFTLVSAPAGMTLNPNTGEITWTPDTPGTFPVVLGVSNAAGSATQNWSITVNPAAVQASIVANAFTDFNGDGVKNSADTGLVDTLLYLDQNGNGVLDDDEVRGATDTAGGFTFTGLAAGTYHVRVSAFPNPNYMQTTPDPGPVEITSGNQTGTVSFGAFERGTVQGLLFNDVNGNGIVDEAEPGLEGWTVFVDLDTNGGPGAGEPQTTTDAQGRYQLTGLNPGHAELVAQPQPGYTPTTPGVIPLDVTSGFNATHNFGFEPLRATVEGTKFDDLDGDGVRDPNEPGLPGWVLFLDLNNDAQPSSGEPTATSGPDGSFTIGGLSAGTYVLREVFQPGWRRLPSRTISVGPGETSRQELPNFKFGSARGTVYHDLNGNGVRDSGEPGLAGQTVFVDLDTNGQPGEGEPQTTTDADGNYQLDGLQPGHAELVARLPTGMTPTGPTLITLDVTSGFTINQDFGFELRPARLTVVKEATPDDPQDFEFKGDLSFTLDDDGDDTAKDPATGTFPKSETFELAPGTYRVREVLPPRWYLREAECPGAETTPVAATPRNPLETEEVEVFAVTLKPGDDITCTVRNDKAGQVTIIKDTVPDDPRDFEFLHDFHGSLELLTLDDDGSGVPSATFIVQPRSSPYTVTEATAGGYVLTSVACNDPTGDSFGNRDEGTASIRVAPDELVECIFVNEKDTDGDGVPDRIDQCPGSQVGVPVDPANGCAPGQLGTITIRKDAVPNDSYDFEFDGTLGRFKLEDAAPVGTGLPGGDAVDDPGVPDSITFRNLPPRSYTFQELVPPGWDLTKIECLADGSPTPIGDVFLDPGFVTFDLDPGQHITCTFTDVERSKITITKDAVPNETQDFDFAGLGGFSLDDDALVPGGDAVLADTTTVGDLLSATYFVTEALPPPDWDLFDIVCNDPTNNSSTDVAARKATITLDPGEHVFCTFTNRKRGKISIVKDAVPDGPQDFEFTGTLGDFTLDDDGDDTDDPPSERLPRAKTLGNLLPGLYGIREEVPPGWAVTKIACSSPADTVLATASVGIALAPGEDITCVFTNVPAVAGAEIGPDATDPAKTELRVVGTPANDAISVRGRNATVTVTINGVPFGQFTPTGRIVINGLGGDDSILVGGVVYPREAWVDGGAGDDSITAGNGSSLLFGGAGNDRLVAGGARDLLVGGLGIDELFGLTGDDILIAGTTSFDANTPALDAIMAEWTSTRGYLERIANLTGGGLLGGANLNAATAFDDGNADSLTGGRATDWFFANLNDTTDARAFEVVLRPGA